MKDFTFKQWGIPIQVHPLMFLISFCKAGILKEILRQVAERVQNFDIASPEDQSPARSV